MAFIDGKNGSGSKVEDRRFKVNLWLTDINDVEIGILKQTQHRAKSRQFSKDMDVIGEVREDGKRTGLIAYREGLWKAPEQRDRRLVIKLFSDKMNWQASLDMMIARSLQLTHGAGGFPVTAFSVNIEGHEQIVQFERSAFKWPFFPEKFSFFLLKDDGPHFYRLRRAVVALGADYVLYDRHDRKIGYVDGKWITLSGVWNVRVDAAHADPRLDCILQLFCAMLRFNQDARRHIFQLARGIRNGRIEPLIEPQESDLYMNPRRVR